MKKTVIIIAIIITILSINKEPQTIKPNESIRFRVIASSNTEEDQTLKREIVTNLSDTLKKTNDLKTITETREYLQKNIPTFQTIVENTLEEKNEDIDFNINYGKNYFPEKQFQNVTYEAGEYESLVITLGEGTGENFWCILFPPLCFVEEDEKVEYKSFIKEWIDKYF